MLKRDAVGIVVVLSVWTGACFAQVKVEEAWARGTVQGQQATGVFMRMTSAGGGALVAVTSPAAAVAEIHEMKMQGNVMKMGAVPRVDLPAGKPIDLKPGGYHIMLTGLKQPLKPGDTVPVRLKVEGKGGKVEEIEIKAVVRDLAGGPPMHQH